MQAARKKLLQPYQGYRPLVESFWKYWYLIALTIAFSLLAAVFEGFSIGMLIPFLQNISDSSAESFQTGWEWFDHYVLGIGESQMTRLYRICAIILVASWLRSGFGYLSDFFGIKSRVLVVEDLRMRIIDQLMAVSLSFFSKTRSGAIINTFTNEILRVSHSLQVVVTVIKSSFMLLVYIAFMTLVSWKLTLLVTVCFGLLSFGLTRLVKKISREGVALTRASSDLMVSATELINGIRTVAAFGMQAFERKRLFEATNQFARTNIETHRRTFMVQPLSQAFVSTVLIGVIVIAVQQYVLPGKLDVALLLAFLIALLRLMPVVHTLNVQRGHLASRMGAILNVARLLQRNDKPYLQDGTRHAGPFHDALVFEDVSFAYEPGQPVLEQINLRIEQGKTTALVGASGAGKTTLVDLIPRFYDPTEGRILLDGDDLRAFSVASLRQKIAMVSQDTFIFNDTVRANIGYGAPESSFERIVEAADQANALGFIEDMPEGFDTVLGDRGVRLSGGQRQRLAIARALLRDPEILILDEATSALDSISEKQVQHALERLMKDRTVVVIAHRLSTVENADHVVVLEEGRIVEEGTYEELLARKSKLWEYHSIQFQLA